MKRPPLTKFLRNFMPTRFGSSKADENAEKCRTARSRVWRWRVSHTCQHRTPVQRHGADDHVHVPVVARPDAQRDCIRRPLGHACHYSCPSPSLLLGRRSTRSGDCSRGHFHRCKRSQTNLMSSLLLPPILICAMARCRLPLLAGRARRRPHQAARGPLSPA